MTIDKIKELEAHITAELQELTSSHPQVNQLQAQVAHKQALICHLQSLLSHSLESGPAATAVSQIPLVVVAAVVASLGVEGTFAESEDNTTWVARK